MTKAPDTMAAAPPQEGSRYRAILGISALAAGVAGLVGLFFVEVPAGNKEALLLALGIVMGWGSNVINYEFGSSPSGRKAADAAVRQVEQKGDRT